MNTPYRKIISYKDWDGIISGGLLLRVFSAPVKFRYKLRFARDSVISGVLMHLDADVKGCLVIGVKDCKKEVMANAKLGNFVLCDDKFTSIAELISAVFEQEAPDDVLDALAEVNALSPNSDLAEAFLISYLVSLADIPAEELARLVAKSEWGAVISWAKRRAESEEAKKLAKLAEKKEEEASNLIPGVTLIDYVASNPIDAGAARLAAMKVLERAKAAIILAVEEDSVKRGYGFLKKLDGLKLARKLLERGVDAGGRSDFMFFNLRVPTPKAEFAELLEMAIRAVYKKL